MNDILNFEEDLIQYYANKRKALEEEDVRDLLKCLKKYLVHKVEQKDSYAINIPSVGILYKKANREDIKYDDKSKDDHLFNKILINDALLSRCLLTNSPKINNNEKDFYQDYTNNS